MAHSSDFTSNKYFTLSYFAGAYFGVGVDIHDGDPLFYSQTVGLGIVGLGV